MSPAGGCWPTRGGHSAVVAVMAIIDSTPCHVHSISKMSSQAGKFSALFAKSV